MDRYKKKNNGTTIVELLVYIALFGIVFSGVFGVLLSGLTYMRIAETNSSLQQTAILALINITKDLAESTPSMVGTSNYIIVSNPSSSTDTNPCGIMYPSPRGVTTDDYSTDGSLTWQKWECYYLKESTHELIKREKSLSSPNSNPYGGSATAPPFSSVANFASGSLTTEEANKTKVIGKNILVFVVKKGSDVSTTETATKSGETISTSNSGAPYSSGTSYWVWIIADNSPNAAKKNRIELKTLIYPRNTKQ